MIAVDAGAVGVVVDTIGVDPDLVAAIDALSADDGVSSEAIDLVVDAGLFGVSVPREVGGSDLPLADVVELAPRAHRRMILVGEREHRHPGAYCVGNRIVAFFGVADVNLVRHAKRAQEFTAPR